ncbi:MAG TPA: electron transfer flavoprotein subunit alpha/FixB family protein [Candidatus Limnocylindrales bacterium]|nr:electron transfer flavoprotein subunit alpha/FixB family protein [Candidatus Limnocylindrales bacterium]
MSGILALVEHDAGRPDRLSLEALALAGDLAGRLGVGVEAVVIGAGAEAVAGSLGAYGVSTAHVVRHDRLDAYAPMAWASALGGVIAAGGYDAVITAGSERGTEVLAHVAARTGLPLAANVVGVDLGERWTVTRQRWAGSLLEEAWLDGTPHLLTVAPHGVPASEPDPAAQPAAVQQVTPELTDADMRVRVARTVPAATDRISLTDAKVVVGGGRGIGSSEGFAMLEELATLLGGAIGVSRVATSLGWRPHAEQIGQTGARIAPDLYIACGISGAIQHIVGCKSAKRILVINKDPEAPIFGRATYAVVGDVHAIVPAITAEIRRTS